MMQPTELSDAVERYVKLAKGEKMVVHTPHEFAEAVRRILSRLREP